ncbi:MAG: hypothetical protein H6Q15_2498 [Bacteroidetes bacterium]|nr:hypothetical protein [Bacteroidota bacterium]
MTTENLKSFETKAITGKGTFDVKISVWEETTDGKTYFVTRSWKSETTVIIDGISFKAEFNQYASDRIKSLDVAKHFGIKDTVITLKCDVSEVCKYINSIESERRAKMVEFQEQQRIQEMIHNL